LRARGNPRKLPRLQLPSSCDVAIVGAGAAGLATAIFTRYLNPAQHVVLLEGARHPGAKILVSGGSRCNVTNVTVDERDFWGGRPAIIRRVLRALPVGETVAFFERLGVPLHEEYDGKLFPDSNRSRDVLNALLREVARTGASLYADHRVHTIERRAGRFRIETSRGEIEAAAVVLATGGRSLPRSGSDGAGYVFAAHFGHQVLPTTPGLVPLVLDNSPLHRSLSGVSHNVEIAVWVDGQVRERLRGDMLWTHFGISGPVALNASRHWLQAQTAGRAVALTLNVYPGRSFQDVDDHLRTVAGNRPRASVEAALSESLEAFDALPASVVRVFLAIAGIAERQTLSQLPKAERRTLVHALTGWTLPVTSSRGYNYAEVTAGGVHLDEVDPRTMESRLCGGLYLVGEVLDVDGRIGGFNFQWAWSSARAAARGLTRGAGR
jgi:predicted Rossmann fold flavoprotein